MKKLQLTAFAAIAACAWLAGCGPGATHSASTGDSQAAYDSVAAKKEVAAANTLVMESIAKGDSVTAAGVYATDAKFMLANMPAVVGRKNIQTAFAGIYKSGITKLAITTTGLWGCADMLAEEGTYTLASKDGHQVEKGKYLVIWKKEDGKWKIFRDCGNSDLPVEGK